MTLDDSCEYLYRFYDKRGRLLYVGITNSPPSRFRQHGRDKEWWQEVSDIKIEPHPSREEVLAAESEAIRTEAPYYNTVHDCQSPEDLLAFKFGANLRINISRVTIILERDWITKGRLDEIEKVLHSHPGPLPLFIKVYQGNRSGAWCTYVCEQRVSDKWALIKDLECLLGEGAVQEA